MFLSNKNFYVKIQNSLSRVHYMMYYKINYFNVDFNLDSTNSSFLF